MNILTRQSNEALPMLQNLPCLLCKLISNICHKNKSYNATWKKSHTSNIWIFYNTNFGRFRTPPEEKFTNRTSPCLTVPNSFSNCAARSLFLLDRKHSIDFGFWGCGRSGSYTHPYHTLSSGSRRTFFTLSFSFSHTETMALLPMLMASQPSCKSPEQLSSSLPGSRWRHTGTGPKRVKSTVTLKISLERWSSLNRLKWLWYLNY